MNGSTAKPPGERRTHRGLGLAVTVPENVILSAARNSRDYGYHSFWLNNPPGTHAFTPLRKVSETVNDMWLGVGVIPLSAFPPDDIVRDAQERDLPLDRFYLGVGSGSGSGGTTRVAEAVRTIRSHLECELVVAALGPRMCRLAGAQADGVLLNWLTPEFACQSIELIREGAESAGRSMPRLMAYVRVAMGDEAKRRLEREASNYEAIPHYAQHFSRMGVSAFGTGVVGVSADDLQAGLAAWDGIVDEVVVRAITAQDTESDVARLVEAACPSIS